MQKLFKYILLLCKMKSFVKQTVRHEDLLTMLTFVMSCEKEKKTTICIKKSHSMSLVIFILCGTVIFFYR